MDALMDELKAFFDGLVAGLVDLVPNLILAVVVFLLGYLAARVVRRVVRQFILYLDRNINSKLLDRSLNVDLGRSANFVSKTLFWIVLLITAAIVSQLLGLHVMTTWFDGLILFLPNILAAIVIVFAGIIVGRLLRDLIISAAARTGIAGGKNLGNVVKYFILFLSIVIAIDQIGIDIGFLTNLVIIVFGMILFGAALAFGLGAKTSVSNILGCYYFQKQYNEGDTVRIGNTEGIVTKILPTSICIETKEGQVTIPGKDFNESSTQLVRKR